MSKVGLTLDEIRTLAGDAFSSNGCDGPNTEALARSVMIAERDGSITHGLTRVPGYIASLRSGKVDGRAEPRIVRTLPAVLHVDGANGFAPLALERGVPHLVAAASEVGIAAMAITRTYHFAALWPETEAIADEGLIGFACVSYMPNVTPAGGRTPFFGTNPMSFAWPRPGKSPMVFDMATASRAMGEIQIAARDGHTVPPGVGLTAGGEPTSDPNEILKGMLLTFGGYKGTVLAMMVELLAAGAVGERFSYEAGEADNRDGGPPRGGEFMFAISPGLLGGPHWADHCEKFFDRYCEIDGARLPGSRRHANRRLGVVRQVDAELVAQIRALCG